MYRANPSIHSSFQPTYSVYGRNIAGSKAHSSTSPTEMETAARRKRPAPDEDCSSTSAHDDSDDERGWAADVAQSAHTPQECDIDGSLWQASSQSARNEQQKTAGVAHAFGGGSTTFSPADFGATEFGSWSEFFSYVNAYQSRTFQCRACSVSALVRNGKVDEPADKVPESFEHYARGLECIHAGKYKSRGTEKRLRQQSCQIECSAQVLVHNHPVSESLFKHHRRARLSIPDEVVHTVSILQKAGAKRKTIHQYILENCDRLPSNRDVHNLLRTLKPKEFANTTRVQRLKKCMTDFSEQPRSIARIFTEVVNGKVYTSSLLL
ncbi:hypothetical protein PHYSODRAFT_294549 [Phytophthora sojae]|uniref:Uncharacterized protein n=1 Tax=Phytophthora sojae (strain P6497) TaxID=1094619 RepID=G4YQ36_PHYSP|nr:hypothetical protein PHYSODRAFT_294549 [Phytophthora sojae]EGZ29351.1 hypothetical protein PHYSODRAFT_294549 [Phytophthora sojae]|eukprot:XP_009516626.1 hypothetical protein PHYSODRAFT_294549 [Phytophthora sojae]